MGDRLQTSIDLLPPPKDEKPSQSSPEGDRLPQEEDPHDAASQDPEDDDPNWNFDFTVKPLDLKGRWLGDTQEVLDKFETKLQELRTEKERMQEGFQLFAENEDRFRISSARKLVFSVDRQALYREFMLNSRKPLEKLHPALVLTIAAYAQDSLLLGLAKLRRVSQVFNLIYKSEQVVDLVGERELGESGVPLEEQERWCRHYLRFRQSCLYYKEISYTVTIPMNSIQEDLEAGVDFINSVYKQVYRLRRLDIHYFALLNRFMIHHRVPIALQSLSFTDLAVTRKAAVVALSNFLALNPGARRKQEISKTKCLEMVRMVEDEHYRSSLLINSQISNFLQESYDFPFAVFIDTLRNPAPPDFACEPFFDLAVSHNHNELRSFLVRGLPLSSTIETNGVELQFASHLTSCQITFRVGERTESQEVIAEYLPTVQGDHFGHCLVYRGEFYCVMLIRPLYDLPPD